MTFDNFPDGTGFEYSFCMNYSYIVPLASLDEPDELARLIDEDYVRVDQRNSLAILTRKGWEWCRYERGRNRDQGDSFWGTMPLYMSKSDLAKRIRCCEADVERACESWFAAAINRLGYVDYNHVCAIIRRNDATFEPTCVYPRPVTIEPIIGEPGGWVYVPYIRPLFQQHDIEIELAATDIGNRLDGTDDVDDEPYGGRGYATWGVVYGPRGHIAYIELDDDGTPHMPWETAEAILRDHAGVEKLTKDMVESAWPPAFTYRADRL